MALSVIVRRSVSSVVPLAGRVVSGQTFRQYTVHCRKPYPDYINHRYSNKCNYPPSGFLKNAAKKLSEIIDSEMKTQNSIQNEESLIKRLGGLEFNDPIKSGLTSFEIAENIEEQSITLVRQYMRDNITVKLDMQSVDDDKDEDEGGDEDEDDLESKLPLLVRVDMSNKAFLEFICMASSNKIALEALAIENPNNRYEGTYGLSNDWDEDLRNALHEYLESRGITPSTTNLLRKYYKIKSKTYKADKESNEYMQWLGNLKKILD